MRIAAMGSFFAGGHTVTVEGQPPKLIETSQDVATFHAKPFYLQRRWTDYPGLFAFRSRKLAYLAYFSPLAAALHRVLYLFREPFYDYGHDYEGDKPSGGNAPTDD